MADPNEAPPALTVADGEMVITFPAWSGFRAGRARSPSDGRIMVSVGGDAMIFDDDQLGPHHHAAFQYVLSNAEEQQKILLAAIARRFPAEVRGNDLAGLVDLRTVYIHGAYEDGVSYVGYGFGAAWDHEHGVGVMMHRDRVVQVGGGDTALLGSIASADRRSRAPGGAAKKAVAKGRSAARRK